jgi:tryptophan synthase alpha chain
MSNRIDTTFARLKAEGRKAFVAYICAGDPDLDATVRLAAVLERCGVDILELGLPFSDPLADGIVNQMAAQRALDAGSTTRGVLEAVRKIRSQSQLPIVLFTYLNPVYAHGFEQFHHDAAAAGADGILLLDLPPDEQPCNAELPPQGEIRRIGLVAPTTPAARAREIARQAEGFVYYISREGVTGEQSSLATNIQEQVNVLKAATPVPVCVGFGISTPEQARTVAEVADGVVVGSAIVKVIGQFGKSSELEARLTAFVTPIAQAIKSA